MPDVSPMTNALGWSFAIIFACWAVLQFMEVWSARGTGGVPADEPPLEEPPASHHARH